ncbi:MAG: hypothetical protein ACYS8K_05885 [Planctomycetota bacterium]|jgi:hypothetical protein
MTKSEEMTVKLERVDGFLNEHGLDGAILGRSDNFAWLGCGASNVVNAAEETGVAALAVEAGQARPSGS